MAVTPKAATEEGNAMIKATTTAATVIRDFLAKIVKVFTLLKRFFLYPCIKKSTAWRA